MRVLFTNNHMVHRSGAELATAELAREFVRRGNDVAVFTLFGGSISNSLAADGIPIFGVDEVAMLREWAPDVAHVHHWPTSLLLSLGGLNVPSVFGFLGKDPPLENPPTMVAPPTWFGISERVQLHVAAKPGWSSAVNAVVGNWWDDSGDLNVPARTVARQLRRVLVVSNHFPARDREMLDLVGREHGFVVTYVGRPGNSQTVDGRLLAQSDAVVTIGRTVIAATALGIPVLVWDHFGCDGWVTSNNFRELARYSFSGRVTWRKLDQQDVRELFSAVPKPVQMTDAVEWVRSERRLSVSAGKLAELHQAAVDSGPLEWGQQSPERAVLAEYAIQASRLHRDALGASRLRAALHRVRRR